MNQLGFCLLWLRAWMSPLETSVLYRVYCYKWGYISRNEICQLSMFCGEVI